MSNSDKDYTDKRGLTELEGRLAGWDTNDDETSDTIHKHFTVMEKQFEDWGDIADEGRRLWSLMFAETIESESAIGSVICGVAASGYALAVRHVAEKLGVSPVSVMVGLESKGNADAQSFVSDCLAHERDEKASS